MAVTSTDLEIANTIFHNAAWVILYMFVGGGPGLILGIILANRLWGRGQPTLVQIHRENAATAGEHNKMLSPEHPRWKKT